MTDSFYKTAISIAKDYTQSTSHGIDCLSIHIDKTNLIRVITLLKDHLDLQLKQLVDIVAVDYPQKAQRFEIHYLLLSHTKNKRLRVKVLIEDGETIPSLCPVFYNANWYEREVWDLYGITFDGHPRLERLLSDYEFEGHPLRKDFPLTGYVQATYNKADQKVEMEPVNLDQDYRSFDFLSPWEGLTESDNIPPALPGDEKATKIKAS